MNILKNPSKEELSKVITSHRDKYRVFSLQILGATITTVGNCRFYDTGNNLSNANCVICDEFTPNDFENIVEDAIKFFTEKKLPFSWMTGSVSSNRQFYTFLQSKGFKLKIEPGMGIELVKLDKKEVNTKKLSIIRGNSMDHVDLVCEPCFKAFGFPKVISEDFWKESLKSDDRSFFIAKLNNKPVGLSEVFYWGGVAGIYFVGVTEEARGQGIGTAITLAPLYEAKEKGYQWAILHSTQMGLNMYKRIGFETICEIGECHWIPKD